MTDIYPLGIAAGMIKEARHTTFDLIEMVDHITFGSFTLEPRKGNKEPVFWFNENTGGSVNSVGLRNQSLEIFLEKDLPLIIKLFKGTNCKICISLAPLEHGDLEKMMEVLMNCPYLDSIYRVEINAACPNHRKEENLQPVLAHDPRAVETLLKEVGNKRLDNMALKIAPDTDTLVLVDIVQSCLRYKFNDIVSGNTRGGSSVIDGVQRLSQPTGGHAGRPLLEPAIYQDIQLCRIIKEFNAVDRLNIVGCGGTLNATGLMCHKNAGAKSTQVATLFYRYGLRGIQDLLTTFYNLD